MVYLLSTKVQRYSSRERSLFKKRCCKKERKKCCYKNWISICKKDESQFMTYTIFKKELTMEHKLKLLEENIGENLRLGKIS